MCGSFINSGLNDRNSIDQKFKWDLTHIYQEEAQWEKDFTWLKENVNNYKTFENTFLNTSKSLLECLIFDESVGIALGKVYLYAMLSRDLNLADTKHQANYQRVVSLSAQLEAASSFIKPGIIESPAEKIWKYVDEEEGLKVYKHLFEDWFRTKGHTLSSDKEELLANAFPALNVSSETFSLFSNADIKFPEVEDSSGKLVEVSHGRYTAAMYSLDRKFRERFYRAYYKPYVQFKNTLASLLGGKIKADIFNARSRKYNSSLEASLNPNNIPVTVYDNLVKTVEANLEPLNRWCSIKKKVLKVDSLHPYDIYVTLFPTEKRKYDYNMSVNMIYDAMKLLGEDYLADLRQAFEQNWIDVYETKNKRSGAYSSGTTFGVHPYVLLNWNDELNDVFTLAHEMGHNMHSYYTGKSQPYPYANYSIFIAEVTSTVNEALLLDFMIRHATTKEAKLSLMEKHINNIVSTFYRQTLFSSFERTIHEKIEHGEALTSDYLCDLYGGLHAKYWGPDMAIDEEETFTWTRVPHFYYNFYVYQYATSFAASEILVSNFMTEGMGAVNRYLDMLKAGSSDYPINVLKKTGVDMMSPEPVLSVTRKMTELLNEMEKLLDE
ncbi:MAG: oligoendopeptidase F [Melioribacteraceae bacterium]|nr:oligoendopeptidase F [Melioribacteraceae bacterium]